MHTRNTLAVALVLSLVSLAFAADPPDAGKVAWAKDYPKSADAMPGEAKGVVEVFGEVETKSGWTVKEVWYDYASVADGALAKPTKLKIRDGKWGELTKDKKKAIPAKIPMPKGKFEVRVAFVFEGTDAKGNPLTRTYQTSWKIVEVK